MSRRATIRSAFTQAKGNMAETAKILGVDVPQLRKWLSQDYDLTRELRRMGCDLEPKRDRRQKYVPKRGVSTKLGSTDNTPLASRQLTLREMRDAGIWVPLKEEKEP
jgi:transposase-like protein